MYSTLTMKNNIHMEYIVLIKTIYFPLGLHLGPDRTATESSLHTNLHCLYEICVGRTDSVFFDIDPEHRHILGVRAV